jgi:hypothetical protein
MGRPRKWAAELSPFDLHFVARTTIKSQVLADFVAEWTPASVLEPEPVKQPRVMHSTVRGLIRGRHRCNPNLVRRCPNSVRSKTAIRHNQQHNRV